MVINTWPTLDLISTHFSSFMVAKELTPNLNRLMITKKLVTIRVFSVFFYETDWNSRNIMLFNDSLWKIYYEIKQALLESKIFYEKAIVHENFIFWSKKSPLAIETFIWTIDLDQRNSKIGFGNSSIFLHQQNLAPNFVINMINFWQ